MKPRFLLFFVIVAGLGCNRGDGSHSESKSAVAGPAKVTAVAPKKASLIRIVEQPGVIRPYEESPLLARVPGYVKSMSVDIGMQVRGPRFDAAGNEIEPGQVLAELDVPEMVEEAKRKKALIRQADAEVEQARKGFLTAEANVTSADALILEAKAGLTKAQANLDRWDSEARRIGDLVKTGVMDRQTKEETDNQRRAAAANREEAAARVVSSEAGAKKSRADRDKSAADIDAYQARLEVANADSRREEAMLAYAKIRAPFDGVIVRRYVDTGHLLQPGKPEALFVIAQRNRVRVTVEVPEVDAALIQDGAKAVVLLPSLKGQTFDGTVSRTAWGLDSGSRTLKTEIDLDNKDGRLRPMAYVTAKISTPLPETYVVPSAAIAKLGDLAYIYRVDGSKAVKTPVQTGVTVGDQTQVLKLMKSGNAWSEFDGIESLASPAANLTDGQSIDVSK